MIDITVITYTKLLIACINHHAMINNTMKYQIPQDELLNVLPILVNIYHDTSNILSIKSIE